ncbi:MAG: C4-dicarboxylate ABC transporter substrate-binding protein, partial [Gammaproteobacteria bacterium]|nr:C4-dicarboxylate ABC transporter substrate-binding protein [Gammaproteobacteria bacterium]MBU2021262.1 C4-dicarboxylate ABC transporter substrate-binding protein [Gammaproteobacteria bacterium]MBU2413393.1 C4-dicarboxylate ABC transporter substrate-binding protein [Gammaproteobacteria bacterium]
QKYLTLDGHVYNPFTFIVNNNFFERLPVKYQTIIQEEAKNWSSVERELNTEQENSGIEELKKQGMQVVYLSDEVKGEFRETTKPVYDTYRKKLGDKLINELMDAVSKAEASQ